MNIYNTRNTVTTIRAGALALVSLLVFAGGKAQAALVTGLRIDNYSTSYPDRQPSKTFNGTSTESSFNGTDNWLTAATTTGSITWSLSGKYTLNSIDIYNYRETAIPQNRGTQGITVRYSSDYGLTYTSLGNFTVPQAPLSGSNPAFTVSTGAITATNVKLDINSNYGDSYVGLNEVEFNGTPNHYTQGQVPITVTGASSEFAGRPATGAADGVFETVDTSKMWMSNGPKPDGTNLLPTIKFSLGATPLRLDHLDIWNYNENTLASRGINTFQIRLLAADGTTSLGLAVDDADGDTTFTLNPNNANAFGNPIQDGNTLMDTVGIRNSPASYFFQIEALSNLGDPTYTGLTEVQAFVVPEPASLGLIAISAMLSLRRRRA